MASSSEKDEDITIATDLVVTKFKMAAGMVNVILKALVEKCVAEAKVYDLCAFGDTSLTEETGKVFRKEKEMRKGIAFPTCISVNNCICHFSPVSPEPEVVLKDGDMVKVDLGAHVDGFCAVAAHTLVVGATKDNRITGRQADVIIAAHKAAEAALRLVIPGNENNTVTEAFQKVTESFECKPVEGMLSHQLVQHVIDGEKAIIQNPTEAQRKDHTKCEFEVHEVYAIDILVSTGEGKGREADARTTVYKKKDASYNLKMKASRQLYSEVDRRFAKMPFSLRAFKEEKKARMGLIECQKHGLIEPFTVLWERPDEYVAQFKYTVLLMANGPMKITGLPFDAGLYKTKHSVQDPEMKALLTTCVSQKTAKKKKKKATKSVATALQGMAAGPEVNGPKITPEL